MKPDGRTQGHSFKYGIAIFMAALLILAANAVSDYRKAQEKEAGSEAKRAAYFAGHSRPFCALEGVWYDWERDETITLGCLRVKGNVRDGSFSSAMGPRSTSNFSMNGAYDLDSDSFMRVVGKDQKGKDVKFSMAITVEDEEYPTQMIVFDERGNRGFYIWKRNGEG
jgi:hypothetical protein